MNYIYDKKNGVVSVDKSIKLIEFAVELLDAFLQPVPETHNSL